MNERVGATACGYHANYVGHVATHTHTNTHNEAARGGAGVLTD